jgi:hypothetical protein
VIVTTPKTKDRNFPHLNATIDRWQDDWIRGMAESSGFNMSQIVREIIAVAHKQGYTPGKVSLGELRREAMMRHQQH